MTELYKNFKQFPRKVNRTFAEATFQRIKHA